MASIIVALIGLIVIYGHIFGIEEATRILPEFVTMKFTTALSFLMVGIGVFMRNFLIVRGISQWLAFFPAVIMSAHILWYAGIDLGINNLFYSTTDDLHSVKAGIPSFMTMVYFIIFGVSQFWKTKARIIEIAIFTGGVIGVAGYILSVPILYYEIEGVSTAMAIHTCMLFSLLAYSSMKTSSIDA